MWLQFYRRRVDDLIDQWAKTGLIDAPTAQKLHSDIAPKDDTQRLPDILAVLGAVLLGAAVLSFVAANWDVMARVTRLGVLAVGMWGAYGLTYALMRRGLFAFSEASLLLAIVLFGASIALVGQMYHLNAHYPDSILLWALGALLLACLLPSRVALMSSILIGTGWSILESFDQDKVHWAFLALALALGLLVHRRPWRLERHLLIITLYLWVAGNLTGLGNIFEWTAPAHVAACAIAGLWGWLAAQEFAARGYVIAPALRIYGLLIFLASLYLMPIAFHVPWRGEEQTFTVTSALSAAVMFAMTMALGLRAMKWQGFGKNDFAAASGVTALILLAPLAPALGNASGWAYVVLYFLTALWLIAYGVRKHDRASANLGFIAFGAEVLYVYFETLGTLMDTALAFAVGGLILIGLSISFERLRRRLIAHMPAKGLP